ncbi:MAG: hypothetical protein P4L46_09665 [Fimbriimonas sp.]|nr:hypothetical protein [Fimbriimonas sp.]
MKRDICDGHPLRHYFVEALHDTLDREFGQVDDPEVEQYIGDMLVDFIDVDNIFDIHDAYGQKVDAVVDMLVEADIREAADSFDREREVHRHVGDFLLFWSGLFPEFLKQMKAPGSRDVLLDPIRQGKFSYYVVSTFEHGAYAHEARIFKKLSDEFDTYRYGLNLVRASFEGFARQGWVDGFRA